MELGTIHAGDFMVSLASFLASLLLVPFVLLVFVGLY